MKSIAMDAPAGPIEWARHVNFEIDARLAETAENPSTAVLMVQP
jgi:hypothetical protein